MKRNRISLLLALATPLLAGPACGQTPEAPGDSAGTIRLQFVASSSGTVYYWRGCDNWRSIPSTNQRWFATAAEAEEAGYRASTARNCTAPEARAGASPDEAGTCTVERVVDGDTVACVEASDRVRLLLIDAPELAQGEFGELARAYLSALLPRGTVASVELDVQTRDPFGRVLAYLHLPSGEMVNELVARAGYVSAVVYPPNVKHVDRIRGAVAEARAARRGLWSDSAFECLPADFRAGRCR